MPLPEVQPGDLITADYMNRLVRLINQLEQKVNSMGSTLPNRVVIERLEPAAPGPYAEGQVVNIIGQNLGFLTSFLQIFIDQRQVFEARGSTDTKLIIVIPEFPNLPDDGRPMTLEVRNRISAEEVDIVVKPAPVPLGGSIDIQWELDVPLLVEPGAQLDFRYMADSEATRRATFTLAPVVTLTGPRVSPTAAAALRDTILVLNADKQVIVDKRLPLDLNVPPTTFYLRVPRLPDLPAGTRMTLAVELQAEGQTWASPEEEFAVGDTLSPTDNSIEFTFVNTRPTGISVVEAGKRVIQLRPGTGADVIFSAVFNEAGEYLVLYPNQPVSGWVVTPKLGTGPEYTVVDGQAEQPAFRITAPAAFSDTTATVRVGLRRKDAQTERTQRLTLRMLRNP